ncbi:MAG: PaaI family thioesterase [Spirochaetales bacterium]|jgi:uncharacterized protein (TIGR00369 family)|nr:PaaI family thioesterase [Spirochaetales bacterium]
MKYAVTGKQPNSSMCAVCGRDNDRSLKAGFFNLENGEVAAVFTPCEQHQGYPGRLHGGFATAILDELIGRALNVNGGDVWSVTLEINVRFRKPVPLGEKLTARGRVTKGQDRKIFEGTGEILLPGGDVAVEARAKYMKFSFDEPAAGELGWSVTPEETDPGEIDLP